MTVGQRFKTFLGNLMLTEKERSDGMVKHGGVRKCLNKHYYGLSSESSNSLLVGSWGKRTEVRPPSDIDVMFVLPSEVYRRYEQVSGNKQSKLLQEIKSVLEKTYSTTNMRGDGQVVVVPFTSYAVEVVPAFQLTTGQYWICNTHYGGSYKTVDPDSEIAHIRDSNDVTAGNTRDLIRMMKRWQEYRDVPLKSFWIELLAIDFLSTWENRGKSTVYYDWMTRDFLNYLVSRVNGTISVPGISESIQLGDEWQSKAETAYNRARKACEFESAKKPDNAGEEWQKMFGVDIPIS